MAREKTRQLTSRPDYQFRDDGPQDGPALIVGAAPPKSGALRFMEALEAAKPGMMQTAQHVIDKQNKAKALEAEQRAMDDLMKGALSPEAGHKYEQFRDPTWRKAYLNTAYRQGAMESVRDLQEEILTNYHKPGFDADAVVNGFLASQIGSLDDPEAADVYKGILMPAAAEMKVKVFENRINELARDAQGLFGKRLDDDLEMGLLESTDGINARR